MFTENMAMLANTLLIMMQMKPRVQMVSFFSGVLFIGYQLQWNSVFRQYSNPLSSPRGLSSSWGLAKMCLMSFRLLAK